MIEKIVLDIIVFIILYIISMVVHEYGHYFEAKKQGLNPRVEFWWYEIGKLKLPSLCCYPGGKLKDKDSFYVSGGGLSMIVLLIMALPLTFINMAFGLFALILAFMQLCYGFYEMTFINRLSTNAYMLGHYLLYLGVILTGLILGRGFLP